jgi:hypothetical protein
MVQGIHTQRTWTLFFGACLLLNFPLLGLWDRELTLWGIPILFLGMLSLWALMIVLLAWLMECSSAPAGDD